MNSMRQFLDIMENIPDDKNEIAFDTATPSLEEVASGLDGMQFRLQQRDEMSKKWEDVTDELYSKDEMQELLDDNSNDDPRVRERGISVDGKMALTPTPKQVTGKTRDVMSRDAAPEVHRRNADFFDKFLEEPESPAQVVSCNQDNPNNAAKACAMEEGKTNMNDMRKLINLFAESKEDDHEEDSMGLGNDHDTGPKSGGWNDDEADDEYDNDVAEGLDNGYKNVQKLSGDDYFPNGADGPVVKSTGPSGARQGDNPEQKKMQVDETHKELVYAYRNFLKESTVIKKKLTESPQISNLQIEDYNESFKDEGDAITYNGILQMIADISNLKGEKFELLFYVTISASAEYEWDEDERPSGYDYGSDRIKYTSDPHVLVHEAKILSLNFEPGSEANINGQDVPVSNMQKYIGTDAMQKLLDVNLYTDLLAPYFSEKAESINIDGKNRDDERY